MTTPPQVMALPPPIGGNDAIRTATRRRHADSRLLMLPNPHRCRCGGSRRQRRARLRCQWRWRGLAGLRDNAPRQRTAHQVPPVLKEPEGPEGRLRCPWAVAGPGRASRQRAEPKARGADGSRAGRRPRAHQAARPAQPGPPAPRAPAVPRAHKAARPAQPGPPAPRAPAVPQEQQAAPRMRKPRPADAGRGFRYPVGYEV